LDITFLQEGAISVSGFQRGNRDFLPPPVLMSAAIIHIVLRLARRDSDFDALVNIVGMSALVVGAVLIPWGWFWFVCDGVDQIFLGSSHLVISLWAALIRLSASVGSWPRLYG
jgi:hypothetical protein